MKKTLSFLLTFCLLISFFNEVFAQNNSVKIKWSKGLILQDKQFKELLMPHFEGAFHESQNNFLPTYILTLNGNITNFNSSNEVYLPLEEEFKTPNIPNEKITISNYTLKQKDFTDISILTIRKNPTTGNLEKLISFDYTYTIKNKENSANKRIKASSKSNSVLETGEWFKLGFTNSGIHKIDYNYLVSLGISPSSINPKNIQLFGNGGGMLPQPNESFRNEDLVENAIFINGESDQTFDNGDYILFYVQGPNTWSFDKVDATFNHNKNIYSDTSFYFLTIGNSAGLRIENKNQEIGATETFNTFNERVYHENDLYNLLSSGKEWYGEIFNQTSYSNTFNFSIPNLTKDQDIILTSSVLGRSTASTSTNISFDVFINNQDLGTHTISASGGGSYSDIAKASKLDFIINSSNFNYSDNLAIKYNFNRGVEPTATGHINFITINAIRNLKLYNNYLAFRNIASTNNIISKYTIQNTNSNTIIWNITNPLNPIKQEYTQNSGDSISFECNSQSLNEFIAFNSNATLPQPISNSKIKNQNLRGLSSSNLLILTVPQFKNQAEKLANLRRTNDNLSVNIVYVKDIYNEFSSGSQDITAIRDLVRHLYIKGNGTKDSLKYLLLFGACSFDYKNRTKNNTNLVPIYEMNNSLNEIASQSSDDYYGFMDENEGRWSESPADLHTLEIGIGRIPARNEYEADLVVNKLINYADNSKSQGKWRNKISFIADAGDNNLHTNQSDNLAETIESKFKSMNVNRIFLDAFPFISYPDGILAPDCNTAINNAVNKGSLIVNYTGHGAEIQLSKKKIINIPQIEAWDNMNNLPFFITATCEFGIYDNPLKFSAGELILISPKGGGIGLLSSTRPVYSSSNLALNTALYKILFNTNDKNQHYRIGDIMAYTKNNSRIGIDNRNYAILGDPSMMLSYPKEQIFLDSITTNGKSKAIYEDSDTIKSLEKVTLKGSIRDSQNNIISTYNGNVNISYFDKANQLTTLGQESGTPKYQYSVYDRLIYEGLATAKNGVFEFTFIVPKDISYLLGNGKVSLYAIDNEFKIDAGGYNLDINVGGSNTNATVDNTPPKINLFMNDNTFLNGGTTNSTPTLIANLSDENGINLTGAGIGHEITGVIDNNSANIIVLNKFYTSTKDNYQEGKIEYKLNNLSPGLHTIKLKAWDSYNNSGETTLEFVVSSTDKIEINHLLNYPNPFSNKTTFHFDHNKAGEDLQIQIQIFTTSGKLVKTLETDITSSNSHFSNLTWNGKDEFGDNIANGVYVYKTKVNSKFDGTTVYKYEKLVILN